MKRAIAVLLVVIMIIPLSACLSWRDKLFPEDTNLLPPEKEPSEAVNPSEQTEPTASDLDPDSSEDTEQVNPADTEAGSDTSEDTERAEPTDSEPVADSNTVVQSEEYELSKNDTFDRYSLMSRQFHEGVAWASFTRPDDRQISIGLINEAGEILYILDQNRLDIAGAPIEGIIATPFSNGLSCVYAYEGGNAAFSLPGFIIVNQKGEEVYTCFDENMYMCGQAEDGNYILEKHDSGFTGDDWLICILDSSLKLAETGIKGADNGVDRAQSVGIKTITEGIYSMSGYFVCIESGARFKPTQQETNYEYIGKSDRYACFYHKSNYYLIPFSLLKTVTSESELCNLMKTNAECIQYDASDENVFNNYGFKSWRHGTAYSPDSRQYNNFDTGSIMPYPVFPEGIYYFGIDGFRGGYAALYLIGADKNGYVTIIDETGNILYDPVRCEGFNTYTGGGLLEAASYNGFIFCSWFDGDGWKIQIIDRNGQQKKIGDDLRELSGSFCYMSQSFAVSIGEKYIWVSGASFEFRNEYVSLDGMTTLKRLTASYNAEGKLIHSGMGNE